MPTQPDRTTLDKTFRISLMLKGLDSSLEIIGGLLILLISPAGMNHVVASLTQNELSRDPRDFFASHLLHASQDFVHGGRYFAAFYLLSHGIVKIVLIFALLKQKLWAYPSMIAVLAGFVAYQLYRLSYKFSTSLVLLTVFDVFVAWLTWLEYKKHLRWHDAARATETEA